VRLQCRRATAARLEQHRPAHSFAARRWLGNPSATEEPFIYSKSRQ
jgi:hypothetical protein